MTETLKKRRVDSFEIALEHDIDEQYQYVPGEMMKGVIVVKCNEPIMVQQILVTLQGEGNVIWEHDKVKKGGTKFKSREIYLEHTENLLQATSSSGPVQLESGINEYPFYCQLDDNLPSSYIGKYGSVTYLIKAQLRPDRKYGADAMITNEPFLVLRRYDLSLEPRKLEAYEVNRIQKIGNACLCGGKVTAFVKLNRTAFIPGEDLRLNADVANGSSSEITCLEVALVMISKFHASKSEVANYQTISKHTDPYGIERGEGRRWNEVRLTIPPYIPESGLEGCDIIDLSYSLVFKVQMNYLHTHKDNLTLDIPITIGTHGVRVDDDPADDPGLRPLYHRPTSTGGVGIQLPLAATMTQNDDDDILGEIDHSLFENTGSRGQSGYSSKFTKKSAETAADPAPAVRKPETVLNVLYGDLVSSDDLPDNRPDGTIRENMLKADRSKKKKAPPVPEVAEQTEEEPVENGEHSDSSENVIEEQTKL